MRAQNHGFLGGLLFCLCVLAAPLHAAEEALPPSGAVDGKTTERLIKEMPGKLTILDVRTVEEFAQGHVPGALNIPVQDLEHRIAYVPAGPVLIVCRTGRRAKTAYDIFEKTGRIGERPVWHSQSTPEYKSDGSFTFP